jgi:hypothetical protein
MHKLEALAAAIHHAWTGRQSGTSACAAQETRRCLIREGLVVYLA